MPASAHETSAAAPQNTLKSHATLPSPPHRDLSLQIAVAAGDKIDPLSILYVLEDMFSGLFSMLDISLLG